MCVIETVYHSACQHYDKRFVGECVVRTTQKGYAQGCFNKTDFGVSSANGYCRTCIAALLPSSGSSASSSSFSGSAWSDESAGSSAVSSACTSRRNSFCSSQSSDSECARRALSNLHWRAFAPEVSRPTSMYAKQPSSKQKGGLLKSSSEE